MCRCVSVCLSRFKPTIFYYWESREHGGEPGTGRGRALGTSVDGACWWVIQVTFRNRRDAANRKPWPMFPKRRWALHAQPEAEGGDWGVRSAHLQTHSPSVELSTNRTLPAHRPQRPHGTFFWATRNHSSAVPVAHSGLMSLPAPLLTRGLSPPPDLPSAFPGPSHPFPQLSCLPSSQQTRLQSGHPHVPAV